MREYFYIQLERKERMQQEWANESKATMEISEDRLVGGFEPEDFPERECTPIRRTRTRAEIREMLKD